MKVILVKDVPKIGRAGEIKEVSLGFARNHLLLKGLAVLPDDPLAAKIMIQKAEKKQILASKQKEYEEQASSINGKKIIFKAKADKNNHLYGSIGPKEIALKLGISEDFISTHLKTTGNFPLEITLPGGFKSKVEIEIQKDE